MMGLSSPRNRRRSGALAVLLFLLAGACSKSGDSGGSAGSSNIPTGPSQTETRTVSEFFATATVVGESTVTAATRTGDPPAAGNGPTATVASVTQASSTGLTLMSVQGSAPFQTVFLSVGSAETARFAPRDALPTWAVRLFDFFEAPLRAATIQTTGFLQIDLPAPVTSASVIVSLASSLPQRFDIRVQVAAAGGAVGPVATISKTVQVTGGPIEIVGVVYGRLIPNAGNPSGPGIDTPPIAGAVVSTSLDSRTTVTDANGAFDLLTETPNSLDRCFWLTVTASGWPTYSTQGWSGSNRQSGGVKIRLIPPEPPDLRQCP